MSPEPEQVAEVLEDAADLIESGWCQGTWTRKAVTWNGQDAGEEVCASEAISRMVWNNTSTKAEQVELSTAAHRAVLEHLGPEELKHLTERLEVDRQHGDGFLTPHIVLSRTRDPVIAWNDRPSIDGGPNKQEVLDTFRGAAKDVLKPEEAA